MTTSPTQEDTTVNKTTQGSESESSTQQDNQHPNYTFGLIIVVLGFALYLASSIKLPTCSIGTCSEGLEIWIIVFISSIPIMLLGIKIADDEI